MPDFHKVGLDLFILASILSLLFVIAKALGKEFEAAVLVWIRAFKRIQAEWKQPLTIEKPVQSSQQFCNKRSEGERS